MPVSSTNKRIAKNTLMLYIRQLLILLVSLYTVRVVLNVMGVEDYGVYSVVGGMVSLFSFLSASMTSATQRFFSFALGQNNHDRLKATFTANSLIYLAIAVIALVLLETVGLWYVNERLNVPPQRLDAARMLYHFAVMTFLCTIMSSPFMAIIIAHEDMQIYAYVSIIEAVMKLGAVFLLVLLPGDKLVLYGALLFGVSMVTTLVYAVVCARRYKECQYRRLCWEKGLLSEIVNFTGWTLFGQLSTVFRNQAVTVLLNQVFNPALVAARAISTNITGQIYMFSSNFNVGLYPPIIKSYAAGDKKGMFSLVFWGSKITFFLLWVFAMPMFLEMETILQLWLKNPPPLSVLFTRLSLIETLIFSVSMPLTTAARAPGKIKAYELSLGCIQVAIFVVSWLLLKAGAEAYTVFIVAIAANLLMLIVRLFLVKGLVGLPISSFVRRVILPVTGVIVISGVGSYAIHASLPRGLGYASISVGAGILLSCMSMYYVGLDRTERKKIMTLCLNKLHKILKTNE